MGMYTGLRCKIDVKPEWISVWDQLFNDKEVGGWSQVKVSNLSVKHLINQWSKIGRSSFIPYGCLAYMDWDEKDPNWISKIEGNTIQFQCSLKNYSNEIQVFFDTMLIHMVEKIHHLETHYEEHESGEMYELENGKIIKVVISKRRVKKVIPF